MDRGAAHKDFQKRIQIMQKDEATLTKDLGALSTTGLMQSFFSWRPTHSPPEPGWG